MPFARRKPSFLIALLLCAGFSHIAGAAIVTYDDQDAWTANVGAPTVADFDTFTGPVDTQYPLVAFNPLNHGTPTSFNMELTPWDPLSSPNAMRTRPWAYGGGGWALDLHVPMMGVGFSIWGLQFPGTTIELMDVNNNSLGVFDAVDVATDEGPFSWAFMGFISSEVNISRVEVRVNPADLVVYDDVVFGTGAGIPEPTALAMVAMGAWIVVARRRRR